MANREAKVSFFFRLGEQGWSQSFYNTYDDANPLGISSLLPATRALGNALIGCTTNETFLDYVRLSDELIRGDSLPIDLTGPGAKAGGTGFATQGTFAPPTAEPNAAVEVRCNSFTLRHKSLFLSGVPLAAVTFQDPYNPPTGFATAISTILQLIMVGGGWQFKGRSTAETKFFFQSAVPQLAPNNGTWTIGFLIDPLFPVGQRISVGGVKPVGGGLTGSYYVLGKTIVGPLTLYTIGGGNPAKLAGWIYLGGGFVQALVPSYNSITSLLIRRPASRKRGRPFGERAGRISKRAVIH